MSLIITPFIVSNSWLFLMNCCIMISLNLVIDWFKCLCCRHLKRIHKETYERYLHEVHAPERGALQSSIDFFVSSDQGSTSYGSASPQQKLLLSSLVNDVIVNCGMPISVVDNPHFRSFLKKMDPKFTPPCRQTVTNSLLPRLKLSKQLKLQEILDSSSDVSLTADIWTDRRMHAFLGVTIHTFNRGTPVSYLLSFQSFKGSHTGVAIAEALESVITDNMLQGKIRGIVTDNASNMRKALSVLLEAPDTFCRQWWAWEHWCGWPYIVGRFSIGWRHGRLLEHSKCCQAFALF